MAVKQTIDGNTAAAHVAYAFSEVAAIYPITPSSNMAESCDEWAAYGRKNLWGQTVNVSELQSEGGAAGAVHGALVGGAMTSTFTASQGLLLMIPNMYKIAGELLPCVFHVSARALAAHALSIFGDHSDVMSTRQTGFAMIASASIQEVMDLALVAHLATIKARVPFLHFFDGFRTSHEVQPVDVIDYDDMAKLVDWDAVKAFRARAMNPEHPHQRGTAQNPDIYFQGREAANNYYAAVTGIVEDVMKQVSQLTGRTYNLFDYVGAPDAESVIVLMGSGCDAAEETVNYLTKQGQKVGVLKVRLYRPFSAEHFLKALPKTVKRLAVMDRTKEPGSLGDPLYEDICTVYQENGQKMDIYGGRYGLGSKEFTPSMINAIFENVNSAKPRNHFTVGIDDDVSHQSLKVEKQIDATPEGTWRGMFFGLGADGTVGANKNSIKIIGDHTDMYAQGYFAYDSKKSGQVTTSHLRFGTNPIRSPYLIDVADMVACHNPSFVTRYDMVSKLREGGIFLLNSPWSAAEMDANLPASLKQALAKKKAKFYNVDAIKIAAQVGMGGRINTVMQAVFFKLANVIPYADADKYMKDAVVKTYGKRGEKVIQMNYDCIDQAVGAMVEIPVPAEWATATTGATAVTVDASDYYKAFVHPINVQEGDKLPVSMLAPDGTVPLGTTRYEKRGIAVNVPQWQIDKCIQCNQCSYVCPHAVLRPVLLTPEQKAKAPKGFETKPAIGKEFAGMEYRLQLSPLDCTGCGNCADVCPSKEKALVMMPMAEEEAAQGANFDFAYHLPEISVPFNAATVKNSQFKKPLFEFNMACPGCGETPYIKLISQLFGDRMLIANATGCSSIYGGNAPSNPYTTNDKGYGPAWANSLFEDNAEYGYGMQLATLQRRAKLAEILQFFVDNESPSEWGLQEAAKEWIAGMHNAEASIAASEKVRAAIKIAIKECGSCGCEWDAMYQQVADADDMLVKKSQWIFGGDGWAYDIGYGGLDHVLASGEDVNVLVLDTEVYSNTGGQSSKASPTASVARFATAGKRTRKKDLGMMAMSYGYVYVATVSMGANQNQLLKALMEAEAYNGPSLIIAYSPCINHGINMGLSQRECKRAVEAGYWPLYRYNPLLEDEGKNPFVLDSKDPTAPFQEFILGETRYTTLKRQFPEVADELFEQAEKDAQIRLANYKKMAE